MAKPLQVRWVSFQVFQESPMFFLQKFDDEKWKPWKERMGPSNYDVDLRGELLVCLMRVPLLPPSYHRHPRHPFEAKNQAALLIKILRGQLLVPNLKKKTSWAWFCVFFCLRRKPEGKRKQTQPGVIFFWLLTFFCWLVIESGLV